MRRIVTVSAPTRAVLLGIVDLEGGGFAPPLNGWGVYGARLRRTWLETAGLGTGLSFSYVGPRRPRSTAAAAERAHDRPAGADPGLRRPDALGRRRPQLARRDRLRCRW